MIKKSTKEKLRIAAINNGLGHHIIYERKHYDDNQIKSLVENYKNLPQYTDIFNITVVYKTDNIWRNSIIRKLNSPSCNLFFYLLETSIPYCKYCNIQLSIDSYSYGGQKFSFKGFKKYCPSCTDNQNYKRYKHSEERIFKFKTSKLKWTKSKNGKSFYKKLGKSNSKNLKKYFKTEKGLDQIKNTSKKQSKILKEKILNGKFTPNISNRWTHWEATVILKNKKYKFRSSWEACFFVSNDHCKYECVRIPYTDQNNNNKTYIGDFYDEKNNILYEIKPKSIFKKEIIKMNHAIKYCIENKIKFIWINENNILKYVDKSDFSEYHLKQYNKMLKGL